MRPGHHTSLSPVTPCYTSITPLQSVKPQPLPQHHPLLQQTPQPPQLYPRPPPHPPHQSLTVLYQLLIIFPHLRDLSSHPGYLNASHHTLSPQKHPPLLLVSLLPQPPRLYSPQLRFPLSPSRSVPRPPPLALPDRTGLMMGRTGSLTQITTERRPPWKEEDVDPPQHPLKSPLVLLHGLPMN